QPKALDVNSVIQDIARLFLDTGFSSGKVQIVPQTEDQPRSAICDRNALTQILMNLVKNSIEAMPDGGLVQIVNNGHVRQDDKTFLKIAITDTGPGLPQTIVDNLFRPVNSTKGESHRGLGLSIVHDLVGKSNGRIDCSSSSKGTSFEILLPVGDPGRFSKTASHIDSSPDERSL
ncbi:MAG: ATP-binding protein, partial [Burkholderiaceae bacterium]|nr:ATP-binding protein [Burkholderiaceae bacterium]